MYKVLWFDDEYETLEDIVEDCLLEDIQLIGFSNAKDGIKALNEDKYRFDAILLDGMFFNDDSQSGDPNDSAFGEVAIALSNLKAKGIIIPWFIYSGQKNFVKDNNRLVDLLKDDAFANGKVFDKNLDEDFKELCLEIKKAVDLQPLTQARHNNPELMEIFELGYLPESVEENLLSLLIKPLPNSNSELKEILTNIRSIQESCFVKLKGINVLADDLDTFNKKMNHLSGNISRSNNWKPRSEVYQTNEIKNLNEWIYYTCGTYLHYLENQHYDGYMISNYAVDSLRYGLYEILLWFKKTYEENT
mgnify:CR=1 FL=1